MPATTEEAKRDYLVNYLTDMILLSKAAEAKKIPDDADFKRRLAFTRNKVLMEALLISEGKGAVNDEAMKKVYQEAIKQMGDEQEVHARHILFRVPDAGDKKASDDAEAKVKTTIAWCPRHTCRRSCLSRRTSRRGCGAWRSAPVAATPR